MSKQAYKELKSNLVDEFFNKKGDYLIKDSVGNWLKQCGVQPTEEHLNIVFKIMGSVPYPAQQSDRLIIITYLKNHKYKEFKNDVNTKS